MSKRCGTFDPEMVDAIDKIALKESARIISEQRDRIAALEKENKRLKAELQCAKEMIGKLMLEEIDEVSFHTPRRS